MKRIPLILALFATGCAAPALERARPVDRPARVEPAAAAPVPVVDYTYELLAPQETGLEQVFDDGNSTFLRFVDSVPRGLMIFDESGAPLSFSVSGSAAVVPTVRTGLLLHTPHSRSYVQSRTPARTARLENFEGIAPPAAALPAELASARAEILAVQHRLAGLSAEVELAARGEPVRPIAELEGEIRGIQTEIEGLAAVLVRTHFAVGSAALDLSSIARTSLIEAATRARLVRIEGGADAIGDPALNARLALDRAQRVRQFLLEGGVDKDKFRLRVASGEYVASNATREGRAENRRVDVILLSDRLAQVSSATTANSAALGH